MGVLVEIQTQALATIPYTSFMKMGETTNRLDDKTVLLVHVSSTERLRRCELPSTAAIN